LGDRQLEVEVERWRTLFRVEASRRAELVDARDRIAQLEVCRWLAVFEKVSKLVRRQAELETARSEAVVKESRVLNAIQRQRSLEQRLEVATDTITVRESTWTLVWPCFEVFAGPGLLYRTSRRPDGLCLNEHSRAHCLEYCFHC
jgi:hypothetical protein